MDKALIKQAAGALNIQGVFLHGASLAIKKDFIPQFPEPDLALIPQYRAGPSDECNIIAATRSDNGDSFKSVTFFFSAGVRLIDQRLLEKLENQPETEADAVYVEVTAEFVVHYRLADGHDEDSLRAAFGEFGQFNVGYHVWPYWREYVQSTCTRVGIPPIPVPMYQLPAFKEEIQEENNASQ
jgi:hypothetical protein